MRMLTCCIVLTCAQTHLAAQPECGECAFSTCSYQEVRLSMASAPLRADNFWKAKAFKKASDVMEVGSQADLKLLAS